uniref:Uncharacterized protein n=1 Tax=Acrobeloides nanus TaxID=290746 RepID=A0A914CU30_9BILA
MCTDLFGVNNSFVQSQVSASLNKFGLPSNFNATNVILPNGSLDPWSTLGCNVTRNDTHQIPVTTPGGAHCVDMYPYNSIEPNAVNYTVHLVRQEVMYYLNQTPSNNVSPSNSPASPTSPASSNSPASPSSPTSPNSPASPSSPASPNSPASPSSPASPNSPTSPTPPPSQHQGASMTSVSLATFLLGLIITIKCC